MKTESRAGYLSRVIFLQLFKDIPVAGTPILCYHSIDDANSDCSLSLSNFEYQMRFLKDRGYKAISLSQFNKYADKERPVVLTFDDGFLNNYELAIPVLKRYNFTATFFVPVTFIGGKASWLAGKKGFERMKDYQIMAWDQIREIKDMGMEIGSHTMSHPFLSRLNSMEKEYEIGKSKDSIEAILKTEVTSFCYPSGDFDKDSVNAVRKAGYQHACSTFWGIHTDKSDPLILKRILISDKVANNFPFYFCRGMNIYSSSRDVLFGMKE